MLGKAHILGLYPTHSTYYIPILGGYGLFERPTKIGIKIFKRKRRVKC
jgi:hypothetical protein